MDLWDGASRTHSCDEASSAESRRNRRQSKCQRRTRYVRSEVRNARSRIPTVERNFKRRGNRPKGEKKKVILRASRAPPCMAPMLRIREESDSSAMNRHAANRRLGHELIYLLCLQLSYFLRFSTPSLCVRHSIETSYAYNPLVTSTTKTHLPSIRNHQRMMYLYGAQ